MAQLLVLVHGAWMDASAWDTVIPFLTAKGYPVLAVNLPGHGTDSTPYEEIQLALYVEAVKKAIGAQHDVILVGHSMAGMVVSAVAEQLPKQLAKVIYVAAYLPQNNESLYTLSQQDVDSHVGKYWRQDDPLHYSPVSIAPEGIREVFCADCDDTTVQMLLKKHKAEALAPMATPVTLTKDRFGTVRKAYIHTTQDKAVSYSLQKMMVEKTPVDDVFFLDSSHSPFFSHPAELAALMLR